MVQYRTEVHPWTLALYRTYKISKNEKMHYFLYKLAFGETPLKNLAIEEKATS